MMFGTEFPTTDWERARSELDDLSLRPEVQADFFHGNAAAVYKWDIDLD